MILPSDLRDRVIQPVCSLLNLDGPGVAELLLGTAAQESNAGGYLVQVGGPALGIWQMEPETHDDIWNSFLAYRVSLANKVSTLLFTGLPKQTQLIGNLYYACAMARLAYYRHPDPIPLTLAGQAALYKKVYNTAAGAATVDQYLANAAKVGLK